MKDIKIYPPNDVAKLTTLQIEDKETNEKQATLFVNWPNGIPVDVKFAAYYCATLAKDYVTRYIEASDTPVSREEVETQFFTAFETMFVEDYSAEDSDLNGDLGVNTEDE